MPKGVKAITLARRPNRFSQRRTRGARTLKRSISQRLILATRALRREVAALRFAAPVDCVYNPLEYAAAPVEAYLRRYADSTRPVIFLGMNPGPYGMAQTGVPFGEVEHVRNWLGIEEAVRQPARVHPRRPVEGFACRRSEVSGARLWGAVACHFGTPARFFARFWVWNYCPLVFMETSGRNRTPDRLPAAERAPLYSACDRHLRRVVKILEPDWLIGIGRFAQQRAEQALDGKGPQIGRVLHPSPANPRANRDWAHTAQAELRALGVCKPTARCSRG